MSKELMEREMQEAIRAGERALQTLYETKKKLESAKNWGLFDLFGGGLISSMMKHSRLDDAAALMEDAKRELQAFQKELRDVQVITDLRIEIGSFLTFADFFFDGFVADYLVQSKITDARQQVETAIRHVETILADLRRQMNGGI